MASRASTVGRRLSRANPHTLSIQYQAQRCHSILSSNNLARHIEIYPRKAPLLQSGPRRFRSDDLVGPWAKGERQQFQAAAEPESERAAQKEGERTIYGFEHINQLLHSKAFTTLPTAESSTDSDIETRSKSPSKNPGTAGNKTPIHLIDVREPHEFSAGHIPGAINIPIASHPDAFFLDPKEFSERFDGLRKPEHDSEIVVYCKAGVRSKAAARLARQAAYTRLREYEGSWLDWEKNGGPVEK